jgi:hypothetical protein
MAVSELEDGREHIHSKNHKPLKYDLTNKGELKILEDYYRIFIDEQVMCYNKDLTRMILMKGSSENDRSIVKSIRYDDYNDKLYIPYRTICVMQERP